jgi:FixJ family two-component response regulator
MPVHVPEEPTVFLVDSDPRVHRALKDILESESLALEIYTGPDGFFEAYNPSYSGCVLVDVAAPGVDGLKLLRQFARKNIDLAVIFLAKRSDAATVVEALRSGAVNFLEKPCTCPDVWRKAIEEAVTLNVEGRGQRARKSATVRRLSRLNEGEREVLDGLLDGNSNRQIASDLEISIRAVEERRSRLMKKMKAGSLAELVRLVVEASDEFAGERR